jgi:hypothetical protein
MRTRGGTGLPALFGLTLRALCGIALHNYVRYYLAPFVRHNFVRHALHSLAHPVRSNFAGHAWHSRRIHPRSDFYYSHPSVRNMPGSSGQNCCFACSPVRSRYVGLMLTHFCTTKYEFWDVGSTLRRAPRGHIKSDIACFVRPQQGHKSGPHLSHLRLSFRQPSKDTRESHSCVICPGPLRWFPPLALD